MIRYTQASRREVMAVIRTVPTANAVDENLSYGAEERIIRLTPLGKALAYVICGSAIACRP